MTLWIMLTFHTHRYSLRRHFCHKKYFFLLICLLFNWSHQGANNCEKKNFFSFIHLSLNVFLIFDFKHVVRDVGRKFVMEHVFCMDRDFKAQLCLWAPPCPINLKQYWYIKFRLGSNPQITYPLRKKLC